MADGSVPVLNAGDVLGAVASVPSGSVLVWDPIGGPIGVGVAELLAAAGHQVHIATPDQIIGNELARAGDLGPANARLAQAGVELHRRSILRAVDGDGALLEDRFSADVRRLEVASVLDAGHRLPDDELWTRVAALLGAGAVAAGDCVAPRTVHEAVLEGRRAVLGG